MTGDLSDRDYQRLLEFRTGLRRFEHWSQEQAAAIGLTSGQHQLLLAIRGHHGTHGPTMSDVAAYLQLRHHSAVGLVDRAVGAGLVRRVGDTSDGRVVRLSLTPAAERKLAALSAAHLEELARLAPALRRVWEGLEAAT